MSESIVSSCEMPEHGLPGASAACCPPDSPTFMDAFEAEGGLWTDLDVWRRSGKNTLNCLIGCSIGDFGAGNSRINDVLRLRPDFVKFHRSLICNVDHSAVPEQDAIKSLVKMLKSLSIRCVAQGIERCEEADVCRRLGFELAQGFLFARPARIDQLCLTEHSLSGAAATKHQRTQTKEYDVIQDDE